MNDRSRNFGVGLRVAETVISTTRQTFLLRDIDHVECRRPLMLTAIPVATGLGLIALRFIDLLSAGELVLLTVVPAVLAMAASQVGVLRLHSLSIRDEMIWGPYRTLSKARQAIEAGMISRDGSPREPKCFSSSNEPKISTQREV